MGKKIQTPIKRYIFIQKTITPCVWGGGRCGCGRGCGGYPGARATALCRWWDGWGVEEMGRR